MALAALASRRGLAKPVAYREEPAAAGVTWPWSPSASSAGSPGPGRDSEPGQDEDEDDFHDLHATETIASGLQPNLFAAAFVLTVRSLRDCRVGTLIMAWVWVLLSIVIQLFFVYVAYADVAFGLESHFDPKAQVAVAEDRLQKAITGNFTLMGEKNNMIIATCRLLPSPYFFCIVEFMYNAFLTSQLSHCRTLMVQIWTCPIVREREDTAQENDDVTVVSGLLKSDALWLIPLLIFPKLAITALVWYVGTGLMAFTKRLMNLITRCFLLIFITQVDRILFDSFYATSKREWVLRAQVVQVRGRCLRVGISWPGELVKLVICLFGVAWSYVLYKREFQLRTLCWQCARNCQNECSKAFLYCEDRHIWPWLHGGW